ncbi:MAG: acetaldehyde dehydrogenase (acetylating) [Deltaproteobacteria bacterium]|nr:acetaldehyde dehydrogenase (acetylating) [Deltaproteobacteria bacterium]
MTTTQKKLAAIIGSGNIGTDLLVKLLRTSQVLEPLVLVGIEAGSDGLARARSLGVDVTHQGIEGLLQHPRFSAVDVVFDATSAKAHLHHAKVLAQHNKRVVDLTPAAVGPYCVPAVNLAAELLKAPNLNMVTCGGQATIPIVHAVARSVPSGTLRYAEIVASIASKSAGPGTRANIDEFTETTSTALCSVGGAARGKAIIVLNPAEPAVIMRDTVLCFVDGVADEQVITRSIEAMVKDVAAYVPGYRLVKAPVFDDAVFDPPDLRAAALITGPIKGTRIAVFLEVEGAGHWLPKWAGNLDIMTSAALRVGELICA